MKFTLENKTLMHRELGFLRNTVSEKKATIPALAFTRLEASGKRILRLSATDLDQTLTCETIATVQKTGTIALPTRKLHDIFGELPADSPVVFERKENNRVAVTCGRRGFSSPDSTRLTSRNCRKRKTRSRKSLRTCSRQ